MVVTKSQPVQQITFSLAYALCWTVDPFDTAFADRPDEALDRWFLGDVAQRLFQGLHRFANLFIATAQFCPT